MGFLSHFFHHPFPIFFLMEEGHTRKKQIKDGERESPWLFPIRNISHNLSPLDISPAGAKGINQRF